MSALCVLVGHLRENADCSARPTKPARVSVHEDRVCPSKGPEMPQTPLIRASDQVTVSLPGPGRKLGALLPEPHTRLAAADGRAGWVRTQQKPEAAGSHHAPPCASL